MGLFVEGLYSFASAAVTKKEPQTAGFRQQKCITSPFQGPEVLDQGVSKAVLW